LPKSLLVIGSGAIGIEFASFYRTLGAEVTVCRGAGPHPAGRGRRDLRLRPEGVREAGHEDPQRHGEGLKKGADNVTATIEVGGKAQEITVDRVILAVGIVGNVENLGLEGTKVKVEKTHIVIDEWCRTGEPGVYAIGDVAGPPWLAHKASHEGVICVEKIAGVKGVHPLNTANIPGCTYCRRRWPASA
jgi:dihydrolipoamide dehydrogenase